MEELHDNVREAVKAFYFDRPAPARLRSHAAATKSSRESCRAT
jgi:hypothetical protein